MYISIKIMQPFLILSKSQRSLKMCSQIHFNQKFVVNIGDSEFGNLVVPAGKY